MCLSNSARVFALFSMVAWLSIWIPIQAAAQTNMAAPPLFRDVPAGDARAAQVPRLAESSAEGVVLRERLVELDTSTLNAQVMERGADAEPSRVSLALFQDIDVDVITDSLDRASSNLLNWTGHTPDADYTNAVFVVQDDQITGNITVGDRFFIIRPVDETLHRVAEIDRTAFPDELEPGEPRLDEQDRQQQDGRSQMEMDETPVVDVMVVYTSGARQGSTNIVAEIALAVLETNVSFRNSGINQRIRLVHDQEVNYTESGDLRVDRDRLQSATDQIIDNVHQLRNQHGADLVSLWVETGNGCGIAYIMNPVSLAFEAFGFAVVRRDCATGNFTFGHEFGHIMSARHDRFVDPTNNAPFGFNHGFVSVANQWRTVMAYNDQCAQSGVNCVRLQFWSNPDIRRNGVAMGVPLGQPNAADNRTTLNTTAPTVAAFRGPSVGGFQVTNHGIGDFAAWATLSNVRPLTGDFNGDGRSDVALLRQNSGWASMPAALANGNGTWTITNQAVGDFAGWATQSNVRPLTGDFNGDGRGDVALLRQNSGWATMPAALANGSGGWTITNQAVGDFAGWATQSGVRPLTGDFNGDGRSDVALLRHNSGWATMPVAFGNANGSWTITNHGIGDFAGWATVDNVRPLTGDFNGDGRSDVALLRQNSGWATMPVAFGNADGSWTITNHGIGDFAGWATVDNVQPLIGDFNNDGRTDVGLLRQNSGWATLPIAFANGNGTWTIANHGVGDFAGWATLSNVRPLTGDFNGDGRSDVALLRQNTGWATMPVGFSQ